MTDARPDSPHSVSRNRRFFTVGGLADRNVVADKKPARADLYRRRPRLSRKPTTTKLSRKFPNASSSHKPRLVWISTVRMRQSEGVDLLARALISAAGHWTTSQAMVSAPEADEVPH